MKKFLLFFCAFFFLPTFTFAFEWNPEFESLSEKEQEDLDHPERINGEYQSDLVSYEKPWNWHYRWIANPRVLDTSIGSISPSEFRLDQRLKLSSQLADPLGVRVFYRDDRTYEHTSQHFLFDLIFWPWPSLGVSAFFEPSFDKREDDVGFALLLKPEDRHEIRVFYTYVDFTRPKRSNRPDRFIKPSLPRTFGFVGRLWSDPTSDPDGEFIEYAFRKETKTRWNFPVEQYEYDYWKAAGSFAFRKKLDLDFYLNGKFQFDTKLETRFPTSSSSSISSEGVKTQRALTWLIADFKGLGPFENWDISPGIVLSRRHWNTNAGQIRQWDITPHSWFFIPAFGHEPQQDRFGVGVDFTWHQAVQDSLAQASLGKKWEGRLNLAYEFRFKNQGVLRLLAGADLDEFGTSKTWEGGCGQLEFLF